MSENNFRYVSAGKTFLSPTDFIVQVDTSAGAVTLVLPKISTILDSYTTIYQYIGIRFVDVSNNASVNNITIECFESNLVNSSSLLVLNTNGAGGIITLLGNNEWSYNANSTSGGGGSSAPVDILYADLYNSIVNSQLVAGQKYRLLDYKSVNFLNGWTLANQNPTPRDPSFNPQQIHTGSDEILLLEAISSYELNPVCNSEKYGGDILEFQAYTNKIGVNIGGISNGSTLPDSSVVSGFDLQWDGTNVYFDMPTGYPALFGHYFYVYAQFDNDSYRQDGVFEPLTPVIAECQYPFSNDSTYPIQMSRISVSADGMKVVLIDLTENDYLKYDADTLFVDTVYAIGDAYGCVTRRNDTQRSINVPFDFRSRVYRRYEVDLTSLNPAFSIGYYGQGDDYYGQGTTGLFKDLLSFGNGSHAVHDIQWNGTGGYDMNYYTGYNDNVVVEGQFVDNIIDEYNYDNTFEYCIINKIGNGFSSNTLAYSFEYNDVSGNFSDNLIEGFSNNKVSFDFISNRIGFLARNNSIGAQFIGNLIGDEFKYNNITAEFTYNTIGNGFGYNTILLFSNNLIGDSFNLNQIESNFTGVIALNNFSNNQIITGVNANFILATHVYFTYNCTILLASDSNQYISYFDGTNQIYVTPINS